ncbi:hypothetical protein [Bradyrhizobium sp.]|uniref:hypothetical protein n=1 Tax=Bradyrhizobium sp. TaxID=376 RepID=UPI0025BB94B5|nr:hypothetical protein [Bradyrhizobium sp.]
MSHSIMLFASVTVALAASAWPADAADLSTHSRLGAIFAEPVVVAPRIVYQTVRDEPPIVPYNLLPNPPWNRGNYNYGSSWSFYYPGPYYGGPYGLDGPRLPYVCGFYGYC